MGVRGPIPFGVFIGVVLFGTAYGYVGPGPWPPSAPGTPPGPPTPSSFITAPDTMIGLEDTPIPFNIHIDPSIAAGGALPNVIGTATRYRSATINPASTPITFGIPANCTGARITAFGGNDKHAPSSPTINEEYQKSTLFVDLQNNRFSGQILDVMGLAPSQNDNYAFENVPLGDWSDSQPITGDHDNNFARIMISVSGSTLSLVETQTRFDQSYLVEFLSATTSSLDLTGSNAALIPIHTSGADLAIPANTDLVILNFQEGNPAMDTYEDEDKVFARCVVNLTNGRASGVVFAELGSGTNRTSSYGFTGYDITSGVATLNGSSGATVIGDVVGGAGGGIANYTITRSGSTLTITRNSGLVDNYTCMVSAEYYHRLNLSSAAKVLGTAAATGDFLAQTTAPNQWDLDIPDGAQTGVLSVGCYNSTGSAANQDNENSGTGQIFVDLVGQTTSASFTMIRTVAPDLVAWYGLSFGTRVFDGPYTFSNRTSIPDFEDELPAVMTFQLVTVGGVQKLRVTAPATTDHTQAYYQYMVTMQVQWSGPPPIYISMAPPFGTFSAGSLNVGLNVWEVDTADLAGLTWTPPHDYSGPGITCTIEFANTSLTEVVNVQRVADPLVFGTSDVTGPEDAIIPFSGAFTDQLMDVDGSETITLVELSGIAVGHTISDGAHTFTATAGNQTVDITTWDQGALTYQAPPDVSGVFPVHVHITHQDVDGFTPMPDVAETNGDLNVIITPVNDPPVGNDDNFTTNEDVPLIGQTVADNDVDSDNTQAQLTWSLVSGGSAVANGALVFNANGTFTYTPNANYSGTVSFTYGVCDPGPLCDNSNTVTITITPVNDPPVGNDDSFTITEDGALTAQSVAGNDSDVDNTNAQLTWSLVSGGSAAANGTLVFNTNGTFTYTPNANYNGTVSFTYAVCDPGPLCDNSNTVTITITPVNDPPVGNDDSFTTSEDVALTGQSVSGNDSDIDNTNAELTWSLVSGGSAAANGTLVFNANGTFTYTPNANYNGTVSFTYAVCDPGPLCDNSNTVTITITPVNNAPVGNDDSFTMAEDGVLTAQSVTGNDSDIDNANTELSWSLVSGGIAAANGTLVFNANGTFTYTPNANYNGTVSFTYGVCDPGPLCDNSNTVTIAITPVNDPPVGNDDSFTMAEDGALTAQSVTGNDSDVDNTNAQLTWSLVSGGTAAANGTLVFNADGTFAYTPNANYNGTVNFTYGVCDPGPLCDNSNTVTITITPVNDAPVGNDDSFTTPEDVALTGQSVAGNDSDIDNTNAELTWSLVSGGTAAANGALVFNADGTFTYTPNANYNGTVSFTYGVCDPGPLCDNSNTVTITITPVNDPPVGNDDSFTMAEDGALTAQSVAGNDSDVDNTNAQLTWSLVSGGTAAANGTLVFNADGTFTYTPNANYNGTVSFTYGVCDPGPLCDNSNTVTITITPVNNAPVGNDDSFTTPEDIALTGQSVTGNDSDIDNTNAELTWSLVSGGTAAANGTLVFNADGTFTYTPDANYNGTVSFTYGVCDPGPLCDNSNTVTITITPVNDPPVGNDDSFTTSEDVALTGQSVSGNDSDIDNSNAELAWSLVSGGSAAANGTLVFNADGTFNYIPNANYNGTVSFTYGVCDPGPLCDNSNTVTITITPVNNAPVGNDDSFTTPEDIALTGQSVAGNDSDLDNTNAELTWSPVSGGSAAANGTLVFNANGTFTYTPNANYNGTVSFTYGVCDPGPLCDNSNTVTITITPVNDPPVGNDDSFTTAEDVALTGQSVAGNDSDIDNSNAELTWSLVSGGSAAANGMLVFNANGTFTYTPNANYNGTVSFTYGVCDPGPLCDNSNTVTITITPVNDPPVGNDDSFTTSEDVALTGQSVSGNDSDIDNSNAELIWSLVSGGSAAANGTLVFNANGTFTYTPNANYNGTVSFTYGVCDPGPLCDNSNTVTITITPVNDPPVGNDDGLTMNEDGVLTAQSVAGNDSDIDNTNAELTWSLVNGGTAAANGTLVLNADGTFTYTPVSGFSGTVSFIYAVCDPGAACDSSTIVTITVVPLPVVRFTGHGAGCVPVTVAFTNETEPGVSYLWDFGDGSTSTASQAEHSWVAPGTYTVTLTATGPTGGISSASKVDSVVAYPRAVAYFTVDPSEVVVPDQAVFTTNLSTGAVSYHWSFGDGGTSQETTPTHYYQVPGEFDVVLVANNLWNCPDTFELARAVTAKEPAFITFPNAFTPGNSGPTDGVYTPGSHANDIFFPVYSGVTDFQLQVFDRWGELIFETNDVKRGWDGYYRGQPAKEDLYVWTALVHFNTGKQVSLAGDVTLLR